MLSKLYKPDSTLQSRKTQLSSVLEPAEPFTSDNSHLIDILEEFLKKIKKYILDLWKGKKKNIK